MRASIALASALVLAGCGSGPTADDIGMAMLKEFQTRKGEKPPPIKNVSCEKSTGDAWECDFFSDGHGTHGRFMKTDEGWQIVGSLR